MSESTTESSAETETTIESTDEKEDALQTTDTSESGTLSAADAKKLCAAAAGYASAFSGQNFQKAYNMKADVESAVLDLYTEDVTEMQTKAVCSMYVERMDLVLWFIRWMALKM